MTFKLGDRVRIKNCAYLGGVLNGLTGYVSNIDAVGREIPYRVTFDNPIYSEAYCFYKSELKGLKESIPVASKLNSYYDFPGGVEVRQISAHLTGFGAQALQYVARATRLDGKNKGDVVSDLTKAIDFISWEIERIESAGNGD